MPDDRVHPSVPSVRSGLRSMLYLPGASPFSSCTLSAYTVPVAVFGSSILTFMLLTPEGIFTLTKPLVQSVPAVPDVSTGSETAISELPLSTFSTAPLLPLKYAENT